MLTREKQMNAHDNRAVKQGPLRGPVKVSRGAHSYPVDQVNDPIDHVFVLVPALSMLAFTSAIVIPRVANQLAGCGPCRWTVLSESREPCREFERTARQLSRLTDSQHWRQPRVHMFRWRTRTKCREDCLDPGSPATGIRRANGRVVYRGLGACESRGSLSLRDYPALGENGRTQRNVLDAEPLRKGLCCRWTCQRLRRRHDKRRTIFDKITERLRPEICNNRA